MAKKEQSARFHAGTLTDGWKWFGAHPGGRPVTDNIGSVGAFQLRHAGSGKTARLELIHNVETARLMSFA